ncbi:MFS general substrate transporter [Mycena rebaudengoi]|nr:MFS general substrate transporter [Mycena rebaudengoi]
MEISETTALLVHAKKQTPLPKFQLFILLWVQLADPLSSQVIFPFINKLVGELPITGGNEEKIGYYAGLIESLFFISQALTVLQWSSLSDRVGRKPVLLMGLFGVSLSMISFGLSKSYSAVVISRCLAGILNGNAGVLKSMLGELTDSSNIAQGMAMLPIVWNSGATVGPIIGGLLSNPYDQFPNTFGRFEFWKTYPYALPCFVIAFYCVGSFFLALFCLKEVRARAPSQTSLTLLQTASVHLSIREVLTPRVVIAVGNYTVLALLDIALRALQPLFYTMPISSGGLGFTPAVVGLCLGAFGLFSGLYQATIFVHVYNRFGTKRVFIVSILTFIPMFLLFPVMNLSALLAGVNAATWVALTLQIILYIIMDMGFSAQSLGATNGIASTATSIIRGIGPVTRNILGGWMVYVVLVGISAIGLVGTSFLPTHLWEVDEDADGE